VEEVKQQVSYCAMVLCLESFYILSAAVYILSLTPHISITFAAFRNIGQGGGEDQGGELLRHGVVPCCCLF
jgi:hypothetical protein